ncbi:MAG: GH32 C-terminal domain-containing protein, partial [Bacteroidota bacterium]|nr:GH32 C-terminal domain-containing protein [Bacteroidota bacterium]
QQWIMALAVVDRISFYSSPNLKDWTKESEFGANIGAHGGVWECPDLFELQVEGTQDKKWVLLVSINPGAPNGGSGTQYFIGDFDGKNFTLDEQFSALVGKEGVWLDYGRDNYAGVTWANVPKEDGRRLFMGWMSNWDYANVVPTEKWRSAMTVARSLTLENTPNGLRVVSQPVEELKAIYGASHELNSITVTDSLHISEKLPFSTSTFAINVDLEAVAEGTSFSIEISNSKNQKYVLGYNAQNEQYFTDRTRAGGNEFSENFAGIHYAPRNATGNSFSLEILVDVASMELFADGGRTVMTDIFFPDEEFNIIKLRVEKGQLKLKSGKVTEITSMYQ